MKKKMIETDKISLRVTFRLYLTLYIFDIWNESSISLMAFLLGLIGILMFHNIDLVYELRYFVSLLKSIEIIYY